MKAEKKTKISIVAESIDVEDSSGTNGREVLIKACSLKVRKEENRGLVSIVLPVYNGQQFLEQSIISCLTQTYENIELIIVNDCSTDSSLQIARKFAKKDKRIKIISNARNLNLPASLNIGHLNAQGDYLTWTSDDNFFEPDAIMVMMAEISKENIDIVYTNLNIIEANGKIRTKDVSSNSLSLLLGNNIGACFLYKKDVFFRNGGYDPALHTIEDFDFWLQAQVHSKFKHISRFLYNYRKHELSLSSQIKSDKLGMRASLGKKMEVSYWKYLKIYNLEKKGYAELLKNFHLNQEINVHEFLKNYDTFNKDITAIFQKDDQNKIIKEIDLKLRSNIYNYTRNQNYKVLLLLIKKRPLILILYAKKRSLKIILKCLFKN